jgi:hypothetical protein
MKTKGPVLSPLRYCASCVVTLVFWAVWLVLAAALATQCYIGIVQDVTVPDFVLRRIEAGLAEENFSVRFGGAHFDPTGQLLLENVQLRVRSFEEPVFSSRLVYVHKNFWSLLAGRPVPDEVRFEGATLQLPAIFSPSGTAEPLLKEMAGQLRFEGNECQVDQLAFHLGNMPVSFNGVLTQPRNIHGRPVAPDEVVGRFLQYGRQVALLLPQLQAADQPTLHIEATARPQGGTNLALHFTADGIHQPGALPVDLSVLSVAGRWSWDGIRPHPLRLRLAVRDVTGPHGLEAENVRGTIQLEPPETKFATIASIDAQLVASNIRALGESWTWPVIAGTFVPRDGGIRFTAALVSYDELLAAGVDADLRQQKAQIEIQGRVPPALVTGLLTRFGPKLERYFRFGDPVDVQAAITLGPGWHFAGLASHVRGGRLDSHGVQITSTRGRIDVDAGMNFLAYDAQLVAGENEARGSYWMNFHTFDYRMLLAGKLRPPDISGWFRGDWWPNFWKNFSFPAVPPVADVDVQGCWKDVRRTSYFGSTDALKPVVLGADFDRARVRIFLRPQFVHVFDLAVERAGGTQRASGWFQRSAAAAEPQPATSTLHYDLTSNLDVKAYEKLGGAVAAKLLVPWQFDLPPRIHVTGQTEISGGQAVNALQFTGESSGGVQYYGIPLESLSADGGLKGDELRLDRVDFKLAGGSGSFKATLGGTAEARHLSVDGSVKDADLARTIRIVEDFETARTGTKSASMAGSKFIKRASGGKLALALTAQGNPDDAASLRGNGTAQVTGAELGEIHLFGLLSQVLSAVALNFTSLKLDAARTSFQLADGRVHFPDVKISGPSAVIDAKGDYVFANKSLDFTAKLKPYEDSHNPLTGLVSVVITPFTSIFELKLTGPLTKPSWSIVLGQGPKTEATPAPKAPTTPAAPATDAAKTPVPPAGEGGKK